MIRRHDGFTIDGKYFGISRKMYQSSAGSIRWPVGTKVDKSWLRAIYETRPRPEVLKCFARSPKPTTTTPLTSPNSMSSEPLTPTNIDTFYSMNVSPINQGQMINHGDTIDLQNVCYFEYFLPPKFPPHLRQFIPNLYLNMDNAEMCMDVEEGLKMIVLLSTRDIENEELFSDYNWIGNCKTTE